MADEQDAIACGDAEDGDEADQRTELESAHGGIHLSNGAEGGGGRKFNGGRIRNEENKMMRKLVNDQKNY
jgi:hypothetical protein